MTNSFPYPIALQTALPDDYRDNAELASQLDALREAGLWGMELNIRDPRTVPFAEVERLLHDHGLELSMFASGLTAKTLGLSLSALEEEHRRAAVAICSEMLAWVERDEVGVIVGLLKGDDHSDPVRARAQMRRSLDELAPVAERERTVLIVEATNRYETPIANSLREAYELVLPYPADWMRILPDTFHMNIEEQNLIAALEECSERFSSIHFSENNRFLPGYGGFAFGPVIQALREMGYEGRVGLEGNLRHDLVTDTREAIAYLKAVSGEL